MTDIIADEKIIILIRIRKALKKELDVLEEFKSFKKEVLNHITNILEKKLNSINELINLIEVDYPFAAELSSYNSFKSDLRMMSREIKQSRDHIETIPRIS